MKLSINLLVSALLSTAIAADSANVYIFPASNQDATSGIPALSPEEARLVIAQRLGVSQYHDLRKASSDGINYIDTFGGQQSSVFGSPQGDDERSHLVLMVEGATPELERSIASSWDAVKPAFSIVNPPSRTANLKLIKDITAQSTSGKGRKDCPLREAINPFHEKCWAGRTNFVYLDVQSSKDANQELSDIAQLASYVKENTMDFMVILMPAGRRSVQSEKMPYGSYDMPSHLHRVRSQTEELIDLQVAEEPQASSMKAPVVKVAATSTSPSPFKTIMPRCHGSVDSCITATGNCSGHGACKKKYGTDNQDACYSCFCIPSVNITEGYTQSIYWGGPACQKQDISSQFWLLAGFSVLLVGLVSWGIGMLFSIGEEKLPGVIGAGVSGPKAR